MSARLQIPVGATRARFQSWRVVLETGETATVRMSLYEGFASKGYRSGYERVRTRWLLIESPDHPKPEWHRQAWTYSGRRYHEAHDHWQTWYGDMDRASRKVATAMS